MARTKSPKQPLDIPMPLLGVHRGASFAEQPPGTCYDAINVHSFGMGTEDRARVGKRWGTIKAFADLAGTASARRVTGLSMLSKARGAPSATGGALEAVTDAFTVPSIAATADLGDNYNVFEWNNDAVYSTYQVYGTAVGNGAGITAPTGNGSRLTLPYDFTGTGGKGLACGLQVAYNTDNDVTATIEATSLVCTNPNTGGNTGWGAAGEAWGIGPTIMGSNNTSTFLIAHLVKTPGSANAFKLKIVQYTGNSVVTVVASSSVDLVFAPGAGASLFSIRLRVIGSNATATLTWASQAGVTGAVAAATTITGAIPAGVTGNVRGGLAIATYDNGTGAGHISAVIAAYRIVKSIQFNRIVPGNPTVFALAVGSTANPVNSDRFYVPSNFRAIGRDANTALGVPVVATGFASNNNAFTAQTYPSVDDTNNWVNGIESTAINGATFGVLADDVTRTDRKGVDFTVIGGLAGAGPQAPHGGAAFRISDDSTAMVFCLLKLASSALTLATGCAATSSLSEQQIVSGQQSVTTNAILNGGAGSVYVCRVSARFRFVDFTDAPTSATPAPTSGQIALYINGIVIVTFTPGAWQATAGPGGVSLTRYTRCGIGLPGYGNTTPTLKFAALTDGRIVDGADASGINTAETDPKILVVSGATIQVGDLLSRTLFNTTGTNVLAGALPIAASLNSKWYCVDGTTAGGVIVDPVGLTNTKWTATIGTAPWDDASIGSCRVVCTYRGRLVVARAANNSSFIAATRVVFPLDFEYNGTTNGGLSTAAWVGGANDVGQPADAVTALAPYSDDYCLIGASNSIWIIEGDPGYGGSIQNVTYKAGVIGPRAWCFDHAGNFYFLSTSGLQMMAKGTRDPVPIGAGNLATFLDRIDVSNTLVELVFDSFKREILILITPTTVGTLGGVHIKYSTKTGAMWPIQFPVALGPWSACEIVGPADTDRRFLIGGNDGYIRRPDDDTVSDDTATIETRLRLGPFYATKEQAESLCSEIQVIMAQNSGNVTVSWLTGASAEEAMRQPTSAAVASFTTLSTKTAQTPFGLRQAGIAHALDIAQNSATVTWGVEKIMALIEATSRRRV